MYITNQEYNTEPRFGGPREPEALATRERDPQVRRPEVGLGAHAYFRNPCHKEHNPYAILPCAPEPSREGESKGSFIGPKLLVTLQENP